MTPDIDAWDRATAEARSAAAEFARRARNGIPPDRWATTRQLYLVAAGIDALHQQIAMMTAAMEALCVDPTDPG